MEEVTKELIRELLRVLESLREVAPMVWRALVYQQVLVGVQRVVWFLFLGGCAAGLTKLGFACWGNWKEENEEYADATAVFLWIIAFVLFVVALGQGLDGVARWLNPSYGALETLLKQLK